MNSETKWTPGEWKFNPEDGYIFSAKSREMVIHDIDAASGVNSDNQREADAYLIAAAPELYEALENCLGELQVMRAEFKPKGAADSLIGKAIKSAHAALSKANGEQSASAAIKHLAEREPQKALTALAKARGCAAEVRESGEVSK